METPYEPNPFELAFDPRDPYSQQYNQFDVSGGFEFDKQPLTAPAIGAPLIPGAVVNTTGGFGYSKEMPAPHMAPMQHVPAGPMPLPGHAMLPPTYNAPHTPMYPVGPVDGMDLAQTLPSESWNAADWSLPSEAINSQTSEQDLAALFPGLQTAPAYVDPCFTFNDYAAPQKPANGMADYPMYQQPLPAERLEQPFHPEALNTPPALQGGAPALANMNRVNDNGTRATTKTKKARVPVAAAEKYDKTTFDNAMARINRCIIHGADGMLRVGKQPPRREDRNWNPKVEHAAWTEIGFGVRKNATLFLLEDGNDKAAKRALLDRARKNRLQVPMRQADKAKKTALKAAKMVQ
ncbi:hypothetical protein LTR95_011561, partial [Oleoguttula sp. CCFEE 5521]